MTPKHGKLRIGIGGMYCNCCGNKFGFLSHTDTGKARKRNRIVKARTNRYIRRTFKIELE